MRVFLAEAVVKDATGALVTKRLAGGGRKPYTWLSQSDWRAGLTDRPAVSTAIGWDETGWTGGGRPQVAVLRWQASTLADLEAMAALTWVQAPITVASGDDDPAVPTFGIEFTGTVASQAVQDGALVLTIGDLSAPLTAPFPLGRFTGGGDLEGDAEAEQRVKRRSWGRCANVEGRVLLKAYNIWEFGDPAFPLNAIDVVRDKGRSGSPLTVLAWQGSAAATLAALKLASAPAGGAVVAPSIACVKWWTQPVGPLTADISGEVGTGYVEQCGEIAARVLAAANSAAVLGPADQAAASAFRPFAVGVHLADTNESAANVLDRLLLPISLVWVLDTLGNMKVREIKFTGPVATLQAAEINRVDVYKPQKSRRLGYQKNHRQHSDGEIASTLTGSDIIYSDGTPLDSLQPAEAGANITGSHTAAAILGQGALATLNRAAFGGTIEESSGGAVATLSNFKTSQGTAAAIAGQGPGATATATDVLNNDSSGGVTRIAAPVGGTFGATGTQTGALKIKLPQSWTNTMMRFVVDVFEYGSQEATSYVVAGYNYNGTPAWVNASAQMMGKRAKSRTVSFGHDGATCCVWIGVPTDTWAYPQVRVHDFVAGFGGQAVANWDDGWTVTLAASAPLNVTQTVTNPSAGDTVFGENLLESSAGTIAALTAFKTILGIAASITSQGSLATLNAANWASQVTGSGKPADNATVGAIFGTNLLETSGGAVALLNAFKTILGIAASISGQGTLATKNSVDYVTDVTNKPATAGQLMSLVYSGLPSASLSVIMDVGASIGLEASVNMTASSSSARQLVIQWSTDGSTWNTAVAGTSGLSSGPGEPFTDTFSGSWANSTGVKQAIRFRVTCTGLTSGLTPTTGSEGSNYLKVG